MTNPISWWNKLRLQTELNRPTAANHNLFSVIQLWRHDFSSLFLLSPLSEIKNAAPVSFLNWLSASSFIRLILHISGLKHLFSLCFSAVSGLWHPTYLGWETQEVWNLSWGICVRCSQPLFGHNDPVRPPAALNRVGSLTLKLPGGYSPTTQTLLSKVHPWYIALSSVHWVSDLKTTLWVMFLSNPLRWSESNAGSYSWCDHNFCVLYFWRTRFQRPNWLH